MNCPSCQKNQVIDERSFGALFTCKNCQAVYFINFDGQPEYSDIPPLLHQQDENPSSLDSVNSNNHELFNNSDINNSDINNFEINNTNNNSLSNSSEMPFNPDFQPYSSFETLESLNTNADLNLDSHVKSQINNYNSSFAEVANEITEYGNTESQIAHLNYSLKLVGLDTVEIKNLLKDAINDSRFGWDVGEVMKNIKNGEIKFEELNPIKAFILAKRLHFLDVEKIWTQNAVG